MSQEKCPKCSSVNIYPDQSLWICPECGNEWVEGSSSAEKTENTHDSSIKDAHGNVLADGDSVIVLKDLKIKGASGAVKGGTKVRNIRLIDAEDGHNIACKIDGVGAIHLKSEFVKKA